MKTPKEIFEKHYTKLSEEEAEEAHAFPYTPTVKVDDHYYVNKYGDSMQQMLNDMDAAYVKREMLGKGSRKATRDEVGEMARADLSSLMRAVKSEKDLQDEVMTYEG
jgi:hypothetical protein